MLGIAIFSGLKIEGCFKPTDIYYFKSNNGNTATMFEICSKLTIKTPKNDDYCL